MPLAVWWRWVTYFDMMKLPEERADLRMGILAAAAEANALTLVDALIAVNGGKPKPRTFRQPKDFIPVFFDPPAAAEKELTEEEARQIDLDNRAKSKALMLAAAGMVRQ